MAGRDLADHARDPGAIERRERDHAVVRAQAPRRAELRTGRSQRGAAALARRARPARATGRATLGRPSAGPRKRGRPAATARPPEPRRSSPPVAFAAVLPAGNSRRGPGGSGMSTSGAIRGAYSAGSRPISRNVFSRSARRCSAGASAAKAQPAPFGDWVQRRVLQKLRGAPFDPGVRRLARAARGTPRSSRDLPRPGSPTIRTNWPSPARARSQRRASSSVPPHARRRASAPAPLRRPPPLARTMR